MQTTTSTETYIDETKYPTLYRLCELVIATRPRHEAKMYQTRIYISQSWQRQLKALECLIACLDDEELACLAMMRGFEKYVTTLYVYNLYLVEAFLNEFN